MKTSLLPLLCLASLMVLGVSVLADNPAPASTHIAPAGSSWCSQHQEECQQRMQLNGSQVEAYCKRNPSDKRCEKLKQSRLKGQDTKPQANPPPGV